MKLNVDSCYIKHKESRLCQGDIFRDIEYRIIRAIKEEKIKGDVLIIPYLIILTQECDLDWDFKYHNEKKEDNDKFLQSILVTPAYLAQKVKDGEHLEDIGLKMQHIFGKKWPDVKSNQNPRYHFLPEDNKFKIPELVIDFKHYYTIPRDYFYQHFRKHYICTIDQLFRESLSHRFSHYLSRIGLPELTTANETK